MDVVLFSPRNEPCLKKRGKLMLTSQFFVESASLTDVVKPTMQDELAMGTDIVYPVAA